MVLMPYTARDTTLKQSPGEGRGRGAPRGDQLRRLPRALPLHWNTLANYVTDHPLLERRIGGDGPVLDDGAVHRQRLPGGLGEFEATANEFLVFETGPTETVTLQWATYYDASDEAGISRLYGGIHPRMDDLPERRIGSLIGRDAFARALTYFDGSAGG